MGISMEPATDRRHATFGQKVKRTAYIGWLFVEYVFDRLADRAERYGAIVRRESELFLGAALIVIGLMNFENGKNCDGNTTDYLSCTRPSTFYYFTWWEILFVVAGVFLIVIWLLERNSRRR